jgi:hypothetical protein
MTDCLVAWQSQYPSKKEHVHTILDELETAAGESNMYKIWSQQPKEEGDSLHYARRLLAAAIRAAVTNASVHLENRYVLLLY